MKYVEITPEDIAEEVRDEPGALSEVHWDYLILEIKDRIECAGPISVATMKKEIEEAFAEKG
ncbi:MAG: hypothetical protein ACYSUK_00015 [Planctomycetota bacterium]|jgi:hypothetical protein